MNKRLLIITEQNVAQDGITGKAEVRLYYLRQLGPANSGFEFQTRQETTGRVDHRCKVGKRYVFLAFSSKARTIANDVQVSSAAAGFQF